MSLKGTWRVKRLTQAMGNNKIKDDSNLVFDDHPTNGKKRLTYKDSGNNDKVKNDLPAYPDSEFNVQIDSTNSIGGYRLGSLGLMIGYVANEQVAAFGPDLPNPTDVDIFIAVKTGS